MIKKLFVLIASVLFTISAFAQTPVIGPVGLSGVVSINSSTGNFTFTGSGVSCTGTTCTFTGGSVSFTALSGDAHSTSTGGATTVTGLNGTQLSALASGILYNTTATGVPSIATAAQIIAGFGTQTANTIFAGPASGSAAAPTFRALVSADIPNNAANTTGTAHLLSNTANPWTPTLVGFTNVGTPTIYPYATQLAPGVYCLSLQIIPSTSIATVGGTSYISGTPFTPAVTVVLAGWDLTGNSTAGNAIWYVNGNIYFPTITTSTHTLVWSGCSVL